MQIWGLGKEGKLVETVSEVEQRVDVEAGSSAGNREIVMVEHEQG